jgi:hypothetical protein
VVCIIAQQELPDLTTVDERILSQFFIGAAVLPIFESSALESVARRWQPWRKRGGVRAVLMT